MIWLPVILFFTVLAWDLITDYRKFLKQRELSHQKEAWLRCLLLSPATIFFIIFHPVKDWTAIVYSIGMEFFVFWTLFDGIYGLLRNEGFWYVGKPGDNDEGRTDTFLRSIPKWLHILIKLGGCAGSIYLYFK